MTENANEEPPGARIGIDIGGTFTDGVLVSDSGRILRAKSLTTPADPAQGIIQVIRNLAAISGTDLRELLQLVSSLSVGTTIVTNAIAERRGMRVALLTTKGFADTMQIARSPRVPVVDPFAQAPVPVIVPRSRIAEIDERVDSRGQVVVTLDETGVAENVALLVDKEKADAIAISYLWSFRYPEHELRTKAIVKSLYPQLFVTCSYELYPVIREYERTLTTCLNAYVSGAVTSFVAVLRDRLKDAGYTRPLYLGQSLGGILEESEAAERPLHLINSGPVGGVIGAVHFSNASGGDVMTADMGGTSFDVALIRGGRPTVLNRTVIDRLETGISQVDIAAIGAGGGSICWLDERGAPRVGPRSAGAVPGPVCYGRGGTEPTVTDLAVVLGLLDPDYFLGGDMRLDVAAANRAVQARLAPLGGTAGTIAAHMHKVVIATMLQAVRKASIQRGVDPRRLTMIAYGGASGLFAATICAQAGISRLQVPANSATFSALGLVYADPIRAEARSISWPPSTGELGELNETLDALIRSVTANMNSRGFGGDRLEVTVAVDMRFTGQTFDLTVDVPHWPMREQDREALIEAFRHAYAEAYGAASAWTHFPPLVTAARVIARGLSDKPKSLRIRADAGRLAGSGELAGSGRRRAYLAGGQWQEVEVYRSDSLPVLATVVGPCIIEERDTTIVVPPGSSAQRDAQGGLNIRIGRPIGIEA